MKTLFTVLLGCSIGFSAANIKLNGQAPSIRSGEFSIGSTKFKNGFFAVDDKTDPIIAAKVQVDAGASTVSIKWFKINILPTEKTNLRNVLSTQNLGMPFTKMESPILFLGADGKERHPLVSTPWWNLVSRSQQISEDPFLPTHEEQYKCVKEKGACFRVEGQSSKVDFKSSLKSSDDGQTLVFSTDYEYSEEKELDSDFMDRCSRSYQRCEFHRGKGKKVKYHPVSLNEFDIKRTYENYSTALVDVIGRTIDDYLTVQKNMTAIAGAARSCIYNVKMSIENAVTSQLVEGIRGEGIDQECLNNRLSAFRSRFSTDAKSGFIYSQEQNELAYLVKGFEKKCPYEVWTGREKNYKILQKQCVEAGVEQLSVKAKQVFTDLSRYLN